MEYNFRETEKKWQEYWAKHKTFRADNNSSKPKYYVLDMFPYPSGAGLHVGHPLGYIASDIVARFKRLKGFNVLHPMGYDSFGLPAEQYAIQTGQHPAVTTENNIRRYREQMDKIGFSFDWEREVRTSDPGFYKWTQWIFLKLFNSWYNPETDKAEPIEKLIQKFERQKSKVTVGASEKLWGDCSEKERSDLLMNYRLAYLSEAWVNWCPQLGTVLANEEVKDGVSERGGYPVERKLMPQWSLRITAYAERLLNDLDTIDWSEAIKEQQRNWIGKSEGSSLRFQIADPPAGQAGSKLQIEVFTTRPDTVYGVTFLTLAPENELVQQITTAEQKQKVETYVNYAKNRSERERQADVKKVTGEFTGAYAIHPFTSAKVPIWIGDYVLAGYGTGAVMGVPAHDSRDFAFAKEFGLEIKKVIAPNDKALEKEECFDTYDGYAVNSELINGLQVKDAIKKIIGEIEKRGLGKGKVQYRLRDAIFGRQRYWGEPIPIYYENGIPKPVDEKDLPVVLPEIDKYLPTETGEPPLARAKDWKYKGKYEYEKTTMPGWAGSSWYYLRYMDPKNEKEFASRDAINYWQNVDLYIGGAEHATGHLLYVRFWTKFLRDLNYIPVDEPAKKLINQGMIQGVSERILMVTDKSIVEHFREHFQNQLPKQIDSTIFVTPELVNRSYNIFVGQIRTVDDIDFDDRFKGKLTLINVDINVTSGRGSDADWVSIDVAKFIKSRPEFSEAFFLCRDGYWHAGKFYGNGEGKFITIPAVEKMSKSKFNVVTPDDICDQYGTDCLRLYEMFLGPLEQSKPWNTNGISGVSNFIRKLWRLYHSPFEGPKDSLGGGPSRSDGGDVSPLEGGMSRSDKGDVFNVSDAAPSKQELKVLHKTIKKVQDDIDRFSFNTSVSNFMICVNELTELKCNKRAILEPLAIVISPYAPHIAEELWSRLGHKESITFAQWPEYKAEYTVENSFNYPVSFNGKTRFFTELDLALSKEQVEKEVLALEQTQKYLEGKAPKKIIVVHNKIVNIVV
ncbi:MAG: leucine--tRNA ligase [Bacteroidota bacterium]